MVPASLMCQVFGLRYSFLSSINTVRLSVTAVNLTDAQFAARYSAQGTPDEDRAPDVYLMFDGINEDYTPQILETLRELSAHATFFVDMKTITQSPKECMKILAHGHALGISLTGTEGIAPLSAKEIIAEAKTAQELIASLYKTGVNALYFSETQLESLGDLSREAIADAGFSIWEPYVTASDSIAYVTDRIRLRARASSVLVEQGGRTDYVVRGIAQFVRESDNSCISINVTSRP